MKKIVLLMILFLAVACNKDNPLQEEYYNFIDETKLCEYNSKDIPFNIDITLERLTPEYLIYRLYIDEPIIEIKNIKAIVLHDYETTDIFPTSGLYEKPLNLDPNEINEAESKVKGIILIGYIKSYEDLKDKITFNSLIKYNNTFLCYVKRF